MIRFTIRDWIGLMAVVVVGVTAFLMPLPRQNGHKTATRQPLDQELEAINARYKAAKGEFDLHVARNRGSGVWPSADEYCASIERFAQATEARDDLKARIKDLAAALEYAQHHASSTRDKFENDVETAYAVYRFQYTSADMEARLRRAELELAVTQPTR